jgi:hypothetical protein
MEGISKELVVTQKEPTDIVGPVKSPPALQYRISRMTLQNAYTLLEAPVVRHIIRHSRDATPSSIHSTLYIYGSLYSTELPPLYIQLLQFNNSSSILLQLTSATMF